MSAAPQPWSQEEILAASMASLTEADIPSDEGDPDAWADRDCGPPAELAGLTGAELEELLADVPARPAPPAWPLSYRSADGPDGQPWPAGFLPRDGSGHGAGFADDGVLDVLAPGVSLAEFADDAHARLADIGDDALIGVLRGWRRLAAWAQARELATITELARRRPAGGAPPPWPGAGADERVRRR